MINLVLTTDDLLSIAIWVGCALIFGGLMLVDKLMDRRGKK